MRLIETLTSLFQKFGERRAEANEFHCGDCNRWERCGAEPSPNCIAKAAQLEDEYESGQRRRHSDLYQVPVREI